MMQGSAEWYAARCGKVTASRIYDVCAKTRNGYSAARATYMRELLVERLRGVAEEHFVTDAMQWGIDNEDLARGVYEGRNGVLVEQVGFIPHPSIANTGASPDGLVGDDGAIEIKCPNSGTHIDTILAGEIPERYQYQMAWQLECTGRKWCDFISYDPRLPGDASYFCRRFEPSAAFFDAIREEVVKFIAELDAMEAKIREYKA